MAELSRFDHRMTPVQFVTRWLPDTKGIGWGEWGSRKVAQELLAEVSGYNQTTTSNWLSSTDRVPDLVMRYLWLLNQVWEFQTRLSNSAQFNQ